jgi:hypothetical protein
VVTSAGVTLVAPPARSKNRRAALASRRPGDEHVNNLSELVDRAVHVAPLAGDFHVGLVCLPTISDQVPAGPGSLGQQLQRGEPLHPAVDGDVVNLDTPLGEELFDVAVGQAESAGISAPQR